MADRKKMLPSLELDETAKKRGEDGPGSADAHPKQRTGAVAAMAQSLQAMRPSPGALIAWLAIHVASESIAPEILKFATGPTGNCAGGRSCARLYLALQGMAVPLTDTTTAMDSERREWWLRAMAEHVTGRWEGNSEGVRAIARRHPDLWMQAQAGTKAYQEE